MKWPETMTDNDDDSLRETTIASETVFDGALLRVRRDRVRLPDGREGVREWIDHPGAVLIVAQLEDGRIVFVRQFRYPVDRVLLELPAGRIDPGEEPEACARRELREETGYTARRWRRIGTIDACVGYANECIEVFLAHDLTAVGARPDTDEFIEIAFLSHGKAEEWARNGQITDSKTLAALFMALPQISP
ncbi:NUDIX domain-containing protein [Thioalkalivibrio sp.]|uniref:NUDIX domain-containing protein n=1 Tax=Thioalkalivibrio sp. TaxID=2093813 RepID=UPI003975950B